MAIKDYVISVRGDNLQRWLLRNDVPSISKQRLWWTSVEVSANKNIQATTKNYGYFITQTTSKDRKVKLIKSKAQGMKLAKAYMRSN